MCVHGSELEIESPQFLNLTRKRGRLTSLCTSKFVSNTIRCLNVAVISVQKSGSAAQRQMAGPLDLLGHISL